MRLSQAFLQTLRDNPRDAEVLSHQLMARSNMIKKHGAGIYSYLPFLVRSLHKLETIIRQEFDRIGWQEVIMPFVVPAELWKESGRWQLYGKQLARLKDRKNNEFCLGPTHEEVVTDLVRSQVTSYKQLPLTLYQMTAKFRDEVRPRFGLMRGREFIMLDGYSFHANREDLDRAYEVISDAYCRIFERAGLKYVRVEADTGAIGGSGSHEFHVLAGSGEDAILSSDEAKYAANVEKAETPTPEQQGLDWGKATSSAREDFATPTQKTCEEVVKLLGIPLHRSIKTVVYSFKTAEQQDVWQPAVAFISGARQLNEVKFKAAIEKTGVTITDIGPMPEAEVEKHLGCQVGFLGVDGVMAGGKLKPGLRVFFDREIPAMHDAVMGANKPGFHVKHLEPQRDFLKALEGQVQVGDIVSAKDGDVCPRGGRYKEHRGIEVGHIFKLGNKYSKAMNASFQDADKQVRIMEMGCYGIGVTRVVAACIEQNFDNDGIIWPESLAPYQVLLANLSVDDPACVEACEKIYKELQAKGVEVLMDDRDMAPGAKFKDADLLGIPRRLVIGKKSLANGEAEFSLRKSPRDKKLLKLDGDLVSSVLK